MGNAGITAVDLIDEEGDAHCLQRYIGLFDGGFHIVEFLDVYDDDAFLVLQGLDEGRSIFGLREHRLVNVHIGHHRVQLVPELETVHHQENLVIDPFSVVAEVFQLQGCPADDVGFAETGGVLEQQGVNVFVVAVGVTLCHNLFGFLRRDSHIEQVFTEFVQEVVGLFLVLKEFLYAVDDFVAAKFLFGAGADEAAAVALALFLLTTLFQFVLKEVIVEDFLLNHRLAVERPHDFFEAFFFRSISIPDRINLEGLLDFTFLLGHR